MRIAERRARTSELNAGRWNGLRTLPLFRKNLPHSCSAIRISPVQVPGSVGFAQRIAKLGFMGNGAKIRIAFAEDGAE